MSSRPLRGQGQQAQPGLMKHVWDGISNMRRLVPAVNRRTGARQGPWPLELPHFIMPLHNPTLAFDAAVNELGDLSPEEFMGMNSWLVLFAPHLFWPGLVRLKCPLCLRPATPHGWSTSLRRITGVHGTYYVNGTRYICMGCPGEYTQPGGQGEVNTTTHQRVCV